MRNIQNKKNGKIFTVVKEGENTVTILDQQGNEKELKMSTIKKSYIEVDEVALTTIQESEEVQNMVDETVNKVIEEEEKEMLEMETTNIMEQQVQETEVEVQEQPQEQQVQKQTQEELNTVEFLKTQNPAVFENKTLTEIDKTFVNFINECGDNLVVKPTKYFTTIYKKVEGRRNKMLAECEIQKKAIRIFINSKHLSQHSVDLSDTGISSIGECSYKIPFEEFNNQNISDIIKIVLNDLANIITE